MQTFWLCNQQAEAGYQFSTKGASEALQAERKQMSFANKYKLGSKPMVKIDAS